MSVTNIPSNYNLDPDKNGQSEENNRLMDDDKGLRLNPVSTLNPLPPPLPGIFLFDRPNQQQNISQNVEINTSNISNEMYNNYKGQVNIPPTGPSVQFDKSIGQTESDSNLSKRNYYQPSSGNLPLQPVFSNSMSHLDSDIDNFQSLEPTSLNTFEDQLQSSETKVYHQLNAIVPNLYSIVEEPKSYHEMKPVLVTSTMPKEDLVSKNYEKLKPVSVVEETHRKNKIFQELKPLPPQYQDETQHTNSKLYQQLSQSSNKEGNRRYQLASEQLRPTTVIELSNNKKNQTQFSNICKNGQAIKSHIVYTSTQCSTRDSVISKTDSQIGKTTNQPVKKTDSPDSKNFNESHISFKEDKPKVYLELRHPNLRSQLINSSTHHSATVSNKTTSGLQAGTTSQKSMDFKLPGVHKLNLLPQQKSTNKFKLPKIVGHNESTESGMKLKMNETNKTPFPPQVALQTSSSTTLNQNVSFNPARNKVALSLPKTPLCYGDPGVNSKVSYYSNQTITTSSISNPIASNTNSPNFEKSNDVLASSQVTFHSKIINPYSKLREELLKPLKTVEMNFDNNVSVEVKDQGSSPGVKESKDFVLKESLYQGSSVGDNEPKLTNEKNKSNFKDQDNSRCIKLYSSLHESSSSFKFSIPKKPVHESHITNTDVLMQCEQNSIELSFPPKNYVETPHPVDEKSQWKEVLSAASTDSVCRDQVGYGKTTPKEVIDIKADGNDNSSLQTYSVEQTSIEKSDPEIVPNILQHNSSSTLAEISPLDKISISKPNEQLKNGQDSDTNFLIECGNIQFKATNSNDKVIIDKGKEDFKVKINDTSNDTQTLLVDRVDIVGTTGSNTLILTEDLNGQKEQNPYNKTNLTAISESINCHNLNSQKNDRHLAEDILQVNVEVDNFKELKVKRKYNKRFRVPDSEIRKHTKRKASWGLGEIIAREKRRYKKRNKSIPGFEESGGNSAGSVCSENETQKIKDEEITLPDSAVRTKRKYIRSEFKNKNLGVLTVQNNEMFERKPGRPRKEHLGRNGGGVFKGNLLRTKYKLVDAFKIKRKPGWPRKVYPGEKEERVSKDILRTQYKFGDPVKIKRKPGRPRKEYPEVKEERTQHKLVNAIKVKRKPGRPRKKYPVGGEKSKFENKFLTTEYKLVDPLKEGLISDDEGEPTFLGFDMGDEDEVILGFEGDSEDDVKSDEECDSMTVECDPLLLLGAQNSASHTQSHLPASSHHTHSYVCSTCYRGFSTRIQLDKHMKWTHEGGKKYKCAVCPKKFTTKAYAKRHADAAHKKEGKKKTDKVDKEAVLVLDRCYSTSVQKYHENEITPVAARQEEDVKPSVEAFDEMEKVETEKVHPHQEIHVTAKNCHQNDEVKLTKETSHHVKEHLVETNCIREEIRSLSYNCGDCLETFTTEAKLKEHEVKAHQKTLFQCEKCLRYFQKFANLQRHKVIHNDENEGQTFPCAYCNEKFTSRESLHAHWPVHTEKKTFTCDVCNSRFTAMNSLKRHQILHTGEKLFRCEICQRSFSLLTTLKTHLLIHTGARKFQCKLCGKMFNRKDVLNTHQRIHTGEKRFQCEICLKKFRWRHAVRSHKLIYHSSEKPYCCQVCGKRFSHPDSFKKHSEVHSERLFYCQICFKAFSRRSTLKSHIITHTDLKPFNCDKCHKGFRSKSHLRNHFLVHTLEKPWLCKFCNKTFKDRAQLRRHKRFVHYRTFYNKFLPSFSEAYKTLENIETLASVPVGENQVEQSFEEESDPSNHFISLPVGSDFKETEEHVVPPSVF